MAEYKCKYCGATFDKPIVLAHHVRSEHKRATKRARARKVNATVAVKEGERFNKAVEAIGILKGMQASGAVSAEGKDSIAQVIGTIKELIAPAL
jgi:hypothetical protein